VTVDLFKYQERLEILVKKPIGEKFIYGFLKAYDIPDSTVKLSEPRNRRESSSKRGIQIVPRHLTFRLIRNKGVHEALEALQNDPYIIKTKPKFIIVSNGHSLEAIDRNSWETLDIDVSELPNNAEFFLPLTGEMKYSSPTENELDKNTAYDIAKLYDELIKNNDPLSDGSARRRFNVFFSRLLFCYFAEDTGMFEQTQGLFTNYIASYTKEDGSDLKAFLEQLFKILNTPKDERNKIKSPSFMRDFDYVNGGLFKDKDIPYSPKFTKRSRNILIKLGELKWKGINPDIFGSMIQAVVHPDQRSGMGMHYTSVHNIMKVINPLFLNELREEYSRNSESPKILEKLLERIYKLKIFDPACGSGNFLIIAYKELRNLEMDIFSQLKKSSKEWASNKSPILSGSGISLSQFYGIELDDFAHEVAILSLWIAEHQMNLEFRKHFGDARPSLPLRKAGNIICANATRIPWEDVCPKKKYEEIYILGNPPYLGSKNQDKNQKDDMNTCFKARNMPSYGNLDYISCWLVKASDYLNDTGAASFVSTSSICQGEQVSILWTELLKFTTLHFAVKTFKWSNNAKKNAAVFCVIIGFKKNPKVKYLYNGNSRKEVKNISPYLTENNNTIVCKRNSNLCGLPKMGIGNKPVDGGNFLFLKEEKQEFLKKEPMAKNLFFRWYGADEFMKGKERWCILLNDLSPKEVTQMPEVQKLLQKVRDFRLKSKSLPTIKISETPNKFHVSNFPKSEYLVVPKVSSESKEYIPVGIFSENMISSDLLNVVGNSEKYLFGLLSSKMHMIWVGMVGGRFGNGFRYSSTLCYNTFPIPVLTKEQKDNIFQNSLDVLSEREKHSENTIAELYDPKKMPVGLRKAHHNLDLAVERCYRSKPFSSDEERLEYLFKLYEKMITDEKKGSKNA
jgi:hypothetical protein